jgi:hypothetical protein
VYHNTSNSLSGATLLGFYTIAINPFIIWQQWLHFPIDAGTLKYLSASTANQSDFTASTVGELTKAVTVTSDMYFIITIQFTSASDSGTIAWSMINLVQ